MEVISQMFPDLPAEVIEAVYESNGQNEDLTVTALLEMNGQVPAEELKRQQILMDEKYARGLTAVEAKSPTLLDQLKELQGQVGQGLQSTSQRLSKDFGSISQSVKKGFESLFVKEKSVPGYQMVNQEIGPSATHSDFLEDDGMELVKRKKNSQ